MSRKQKSRADTPAPQVAQVDAIERLLNEQRFHEAVAKADRLAQQFPDHVRLRDLRIRAVASAGDVPRAALMAEAWTRTQPNSQRAWSLLFGLGADLGLGYLAHACHRRLDALGAEDPQRTKDANTLIEAIRAKYVGLSDEEGLRSDRGLLFLIGERLEEAVAELSSATHVVPRTNLAGAYFDQGDMTQAIAVARDAWKADTCNTHAARILARALLYVGDADGVRAVGEQLRDVVAREPDELAAQLETLDLLEDYAAARERYEAFPRTGFESFRRDMLARMYHAAAVACFNLGDRDKARLLWQDAVQNNGQHPLYMLNLHLASRTDTNEPACREMLSEAFPAAFERLLRPAIERAGGGKALIDEPSRLDLELQGHSLYLGHLLRQTDEMSRALMREALAARLERGDADAEAELRRFIVFAHGADQERVEALRALYFAGKLPPAGVVSVYLRGALRNLDVTIPRVRRVRPLQGMPDAAQAAYIDTVFANEPSELRAALQTLRKLRAQATDEAAQRVLDHRVMVTMHSLGAHQNEGAALLKEMLHDGQALARTHAFAARLALLRGEVKSAQSLLDGQLARAGADDEDLAPVLHAQRELHAARGETDQELAAWIAQECLGAVSAPEA